MSAGSLLLSNSEFVQTQAGFYSDLLKNQELTDVTLACDGYQIGVHKTVISASSLFFRDVIKNSKHQNLFIFLKGVSKETLDSILQFVYIGEATVQSENLERLVEVGNELKVIGLMEEDQSNDLKSNKSKKKTRNVQVTKHCQEKQDNIESGKQEREVLSKNEDEKFERVKVEEDSEKLTQEVNKRLVTKKDENDRVIHMCTVCEKEGRKKDKMRLHIETHLDGFSHKCQYCDVVKKTTATIQFHEWYFHTRGNSNTNELMTPLISHD